MSGQSGLTTLECHHNNISILDITQAPALLTLECGNNLISELDFSNSPNINQASCQNNPLTNVDFSGVVDMYSINLSSTMLSSITLPTGSTSNLYLQNNPSLLSIFAKDGTATNASVSNCSDLEYICSDLGHIDFWQAKCPPCNVNSYCSFTPGGTFYTIQGTAHIDLDNNGCDASDPVTSHIKVKVTSGATSGYTIADNSGSYSIPLQAGNYTLTPEVENPNYFSLVPATISVAFPAQSSPYNQIFCLESIGTHPDLEVFIIPLDDAIPGFDANYKLVIRNKGTNIQSGSVNLNYNDDLMDFINATTLPDFQNIGVLQWNFNGMLPFESADFNFSMEINAPTDNPPVNEGDFLWYEAVLNSPSTDETPNDNSFALNQQVYNSFDPNDKTCLEGNIVGPEMVGEYVHYLIRFENTGTFAAQNIVVKDMIDLTKFDISTLVPLHASHSFETRISAGNKVEFIFENIQLPFDDAANDGYVAFKIKTLATLQAGDTFSNNASIYFDYNFPIVTNTASTEIQLLNTAGFDFDNHFTIYPNPAKDVLNINVSNDITPKSAAIYNMLGQKVIDLIGWQSSIDVSQLNSGIYMLEVTSARGRSAKAFIIN